MIASMLRVPAMRLASAGHDLHLAHDGEQSLAVANECRPNEVLLDIGLPKLGGMSSAGASASRTEARH